MILPASVVRPRQQDGKIHWYTGETGMGSAPLRQVCVILLDRKRPENNSCLFSDLMGEYSKGRSVFISVKSPGSWNKSTGEKCHLITELA